MSAYQKLHGFLLYRPAYLAAEFEEKNHERYVASENDWAKAMVVRMTKAIGSCYYREELAKVSKLDGKSSDTSFMPGIGDKVLVHFPEGSGSKLIPNWKGIYRVREKLDKNTYIVSLEGNERKKHVVHRHRMRSISELKVQQNTSEVSETHVEKENATALKETTERRNDEKLAPEYPMKPQLISKESSNNSENEQSVVKRPKRTAAIKARDKMIKMR